MTLDEVLVQTGGVVAERQNQFMAELNSLPWDFDMDTGLLTFDEKHRYHVQIVGSFAEEDNSWEWAWADRQSDIPAALLVAANRLRQEGLGKNIEIFTKPLVKMPSSQVRPLMMGAAGLDDARAFFLGVHGHQTVGFLIDDAKVPPLPAPEALRIIDTFNALISGVSIVDHHRAYEAYLRARGFTVESRGSRLIGTRPNTGTIIAQFDTRGRLAKAFTTAAPASR